MRRVKYKILDGWSLKNPEEDAGTNALKIYMPYGLPECVLMPGDDTLIPTGLHFPGLFKDFIIIPIHHTYPNKGSDVMEMWNGKLNETHPIYIVTEGYNGGKTYTKIQRSEKFKRKLL